MTKARFALFKRIVGLFICNPVVGNLIGFLYRDRIPFRGVMIDVSLANVQPKNKCSLRFNMYESAEARFVEKYLYSQIDTVDLGASLGAISSKIASILEPGVSLTCVEGNPQLIPCLKRNLDINATHLRTFLTSAAIAYGTDSVQFVVMDDNLCSSANNKSTFLSVDVPAVELNQLLAQNQIGTYQLVCDIEGAELGIVQNDSLALLNCVQIIMELHGIVQGDTTIDENMLIKMFLEKGFALIDRYGSVVVLRRDIPVDFTRSLA
jgi:FkbM family methyltransferase